MTEITLKHVILGMARSSLLGAIALVVFGFPEAAEAQVCSIGKRCGNTCIARNLTCHIETDRVPQSAPSCRVANVVDGDTLDCADGRRIRLLLIDAPEMAQQGFGERAKITLEELARVGTELSVELDVQPTDRYGRTLAHLHHPSSGNINRRLLELGVAVVGVYPPNVRHVEDYRRVAERARLAGHGLWSLGGFDCAPAAFRAKRCEG